MRVLGSKLESAENELKQLMAEVSRAMERAEQAVARVAHKGAAADAPAAPATSRAA